MARDRIPIVVLGNDGRPLAGASVTVRNHPAGTTATIYSDDTSGATLANPLTSDARGYVAGWVNRGMYAATITASGFGPFVEYFSAAPGGAKQIDAPWVGDDALAAITAALLPIGTRIGYAGAGDPAPVTGGPVWLLCDGRALSRTTYAALYAVIGGTYGNGDGATTFNLPDLRGRSPVGANDMGTGAGPNTNARAQLARGAAGGEVAHTLTATEIPSHTHADGTLSASSAGSHTHTGGTGGVTGPLGSGMVAGVNWGNTAGGGGFAVAANQGVSNFPVSQVQDHRHGFTTDAGGTHTHDVAGSTAAAGGGDPHANLAPVVGEGALIRAA